MADFIIVIAAAVMLTGPAPAPTALASASPDAAPTAGLRVYPDAASCEQATATLVAPPDARLVCLPVEPMAGAMASAS